MITRNQQLLVKDAFNLDVPEKVICHAFEDDTNPHIPMEDANYVFRRENVRDLLSFLNDPDGDGMFLFGAYGTGKTSIAYQLASRLNWPCQAYTAHSRMEFDDLVGTWKLVNGEMKWLDGALTTAMREGHIFILNEIDRADPGQLAGLHDILEGHPLVIAANGGEVVRMHPNFRFICNGNSNGTGDSTGLHQGVNMLDAAFMDRFRMIQVNYPESEVEAMILENKAPKLPEEIRTKMIELANRIRVLYVGDDSAEQTLTVTLSTRTLCRWAKLTMAFRSAPNALHYALNQALLCRTEPEQRAAIERLAQDVFGELWGAVA